MKTEKKIQRKMKGINRARQAWAQQIRDDSKYRVRVTKPTVKSARIPRPLKLKIRSIRGLYQRSKRAKSKEIEITSIKGKYSEK